MRVFILLTLALASACGAPPAPAAPGGDLDLLLDEAPADPAAQETDVSEPDPTGSLAVWAKVVLVPADTSTIERLRRESQARIQSLDADLQEARSRSPYASIDRRQGLLRRIAFETERLRLIDAQSR